MHEISVDLGYSRSTIIRYINLLIDVGYVIQMSEGRLIKYSISKLGKKYIVEKGLTFKEKDKLKSEEKSSQSLYKATAILLEIENIKKNFDNQKKEFEEQKKAFEMQIKSSNKKINNINNKIDTFYGKIGEIIALLIGSMSIIAFNIKVMETTKIDFNNGYKDAFLNILAIDLPLIILMVIATFLFNYIIGKEINTKRAVFIVIIILICSIALVV